MESNLVKLALAAVVILGGAILAMMYWPSGEEGPEPNTVYDVWESDEDRLRADPRQEVQETTQQQAPVATTNQQAQPPVTQTQTQQPATQTQPPVAEVTAEPKYNFKGLDTAEEYDAERLWNWIVQKRKMGRLPGGFGYKEMTDKCRELKRRYPDTIHDFKASRAIGDIPERYRKMYTIEDGEFDLKRFEVGATAP